MGVLQKIKATLNRLQRRPAAFWVALLVLNGLLFVPAALLRSPEGSLFPWPPFHGRRGLIDTALFFLRRENPDFFRLSADFLFLLTLLWLTSRSVWKRIVRRGALSFYFFLLVYQIYEAIILRLFGQQPVLYNDAMHLLDAFYLAVELSPRFVFASIAITLSVLLIGWSAPRLFSIMEYHLGRVQMYSKTLLAAMFSWGIILMMAFWFGFRSYISTVQWTTPRIAYNLQESVRWHLHLRHPPAFWGDSTYLAFDHIHLQEKPNVYLILVESYGKILAQHADLNELYYGLMIELENKLEKGGWRAVSNYSEAPIRGARSWLSEATILTGVRLDNQAVYARFMERLSEHVQLVRFFKQQGYSTLTLQPPNRRRPGIPVKNDYQFDAPIFYEDLNYRGAVFGWGIVPDQYSLYYAHENYLSAVRGPFFLQFMTVTSHAPWDQLPPYALNWEEIGQPLPQPHSESAAKPTCWQRLVLKASAALRLIREKVKYRGALREPDYFKHIAYELNLMADYIVHVAPKKSVFILIGDHQPPVLTRDRDGFQTPIHIIFQNAVFLESFSVSGFVPGLLKDPLQSGTIKHENVFPLLVEALKTGSGSAGEETLAVSSGAANPASSSLP